MYENTLSKTNRPPVNVLRSLGVAAALAVGCLLLAIAGCGERPVVAKNKPKAAPTEKNGVPESPTTGPAAARPFQPAPPIATDVPQDNRPAPRPDVPLERRTLANLAEQAVAQEYALPEVDEGKAAAAGIRPLRGKHITIYTDVPDSPDVAELPAVFDAAVPLWGQYFDVDRASLADWKLVGFLMQDKARFQGAGLLPDDLPAFPNGFQRGSQFWWFEQPSSYYRRHLMLHEGTHGFMNRWLGGAGPPWYMEGTAELLGTHQWDGGKLTLAYNPQNKEEVPYWGRVKIVKDEFAANRGMQLTDILRYDAHAHLRNEPYGWCWAAAQFFDQHPRTQAAFRALRAETKDRSIDFSTRFIQPFQEDWPTLAEDWQLMVVNIDYGYDVARAAIVRKPTSTLPPQGGTANVAADRGWQSTGYRLEAGKTYQIEAQGRYLLARDPAAWPCEPGGITLHYHGGQPLGQLQAGLSELESPTGMTPLARPTPIGLSGQFTPSQNGVLYLRVNEPASGLADNQGSLTARITPK